ncbi:MAG: porin, partial [Caulobacteraceae bacterium]
MQFKTTLLGGAALSCMLVLGAIAPAQAKTTAAEAARMQMLEGQVRMLTERLNAQEAAQAQTASTVEKIPAQVQTAVAALPKPKAGWEANTAITGRMYANVSNIEHESDGVKLPDSGVSTDVKRFYVGIDHKFSD